MNKFFNVKIKFRRSFLHIHIDMKFCMIFFRLQDNIRLFEDKISFNFYMEIVLPIFYPPTFWLACTANNLAFLHRQQFGLHHQRFWRRKQKCWHASKNVGQQAKMLACEQKCWLASKNVGMRAKMLACEQKCWLASKNVGMQAKMLANNSLKNFPYKKLKYYILRVLFCSKV